MDNRPDWIVVVGDVNSTAACAMVGKTWIPVVHLEAGLRSGDRSMPDEINRLVTDAICDLLWTPSADADSKIFCTREYRPQHRSVGNMMIDSFELLRERIEKSNSRESHGLGNDYAVLTLHRPSNVDDPKKLRASSMPLKKLPLISALFSYRIRGRSNLKNFDLYDRLSGIAGVECLNLFPTSIS